MKNAVNFHRNLQQRTMGKINTMMPGTIVRYNPVENKADIELQDGTLIMEIPMGTIQTSDFYIRVPYTVGDLVAVMFAQNDIDGLFHGDAATPSERKFSLDDAIGAFGLNTFDDPLPATDPDKLVIGQKDDKAKISMGYGEIHVTGKFFVNGSEIGGES